MRRPARPHSSSNASSGSGPSPYARPNRSKQPESKKACRAASSPALRAHCATLEATKATSAAGEWEAAALVAVSLAHASTSAPIA